MAKLRAGDPAPDFALPGAGGRTHRLSDHRGEWVALAFYPADFSPGCTRQLCSYRDRGPELGEAEVTLLGISPQGAESHERFAAAHGLEMPLLADENRAVARAYGVIGPGGVIRRSVVIVDPEGGVRHVERSLIGLGYMDGEEIASRVRALREGG